MTVNDAISTLACMAKRGYGDVELVHALDNQYEDVAGLTLHTKATAPCEWIYAGPVAVVSLTPGAST